MAYDAAAADLHQAVADQRHPDVSLPVAVEVVDPFPSQLGKRLGEGVAQVPLLSRGDTDLVVSVVRPHQQPVVRREEQPDHVEPLRLRQEVRLPCGVAREEDPHAPQSAEPDVASFVLLQRLEEVAVPARVVELSDGVAGDQVDIAALGEEDLVVRQPFERAHHVLAQLLLMAEVAAEGAVGLSGDHPVHEGGEGQPSRGAPVDVLRECLLPVHLGHHAVVEAVAVEAGDAAVGGDPEIAPVVLVDAEDGVVGQAVVHGVGAEEVSFLRDGGGEGSPQQQCPQEWAEDRMAGRYVMHDPL